MKIASSYYKQKKTKTNLMSSMYKMDMIIAVGIVIVAVDSPWLVELDRPLYIPAAVTPAIEQAKEIQKDIE